jgi:hypothetical protein
MSWPKAFVLAAIAIAGATLLAYDPATSRLFPPCPFRALTGLACPGCGTLRALHQGLHGNLAAAFYLNPLSMLMIPLVACVGLVQGACAVLGRPAPEIHLGAARIWTLLAVILLFWVLRNLPWAPFTWFAS